MFEQWHAALELSQRWMRHRLICLRLLSLALLYAISNVAQAGPITVQFTGLVTQVPIDEVFGDINFQDAITGSYTLNSLAVDGAPSDPTTGSYSVAGPPYGFSSTIDGHEFATTDFLNIGIFNGAVDQYSVLGQSSAGDLALEIFLQDDTGAVFANDLLPLGAPPLGSFGQRDFHLTATINGGQLQVDGTVDSLSCVSGCVASTAPEPASADLVGAAIVAWGLLRAVRARRPRMHAGFMRFTNRGGF